MKNISLIKSLALYCGIGYFNSFMSINVINPLKHQPPLPDFLFDYLPKISDWIPHGMLFLMTIYFLYQNYHNTPVLVKTYNRITFLFCLRVLTFVSTPLPPSLPGCISREPDESLHWDLLSDLIKSRDNTCLDMMFSGHATHLTAFSIICWEKANRQHKIWIATFTTIGLISIVSSHLHYTADVLVAIFLTYLTFLIY